MSLSHDRQEGDAMSEYLCEFNFFDRHLGCTRFICVEVPSIGHVKDGFWVTMGQQFTTGSDALYWIPPAQIRFVEKVS